MKIAIVAAGFTPSEADQLRRAMATFRRVGTIQTFHDEDDRGHGREGLRPRLRRALLPADRGLRRIRLSREPRREFRAARLRLVLDEMPLSRRLRCAAMLNAQPLGFYAPAQLVRDAREHGVEVREVDVNLSDWDCTLEALPLSRLRERAAASPPDEGPSREAVVAEPLTPAPLPQGERGVRLHRRHADMADAIRTTHAVRLGLRQIVGAREEEMRRLVERRGEATIPCATCGCAPDCPLATLEKLADADAFRSLGLDRREALWAVRGARPCRRPGRSAAVRGDAGPSAPPSPTRSCRRCRSARMWSRTTAGCRCR